MTRAEPDTDELLERSVGGDLSVRGALLERHRARLRRLVTVHLDTRLTARLDPSDVVQDALAEASRRLDDYLRQRPLPFYPWLRQIALDRLSDQHRRHVRAERRSVLREEEVPFRLPDHSALELARLVAGGGSPSSALQQREVRDRVRAALEKLSPAEREVLVLRYLEPLSAAEVAAILRISEDAARKRVLRALQRLRKLLEDLTPEGRHEPDLQTGQLCRTGVFAAGQTGRSVDRATPGRRSDRLGRGGAGSSPPRRRVAPALAGVGGPGRSLALGSLGYWRRRWARLRGRQRDDRRPRRLSHRA
jgi:RNA polymerase sigma-70 factor (ECF subfamily)